MIVIVCGSRRLTDGAFVFDNLDIIHARQNITLLVEGGQRTSDKDDRSKIIGGADYFAFMWAAARGIPHRTEPAAWNDLSHSDAQIRKNPNGVKYDARAGGRRNQLMIDKYNPTRCIGFPIGSSPGTRDMLKRARRAGLDIVEIAQ